MSAAFRCDTVSCPRKIFAERLGPFIEAWARKTTRLREAIEAIGTSTCGEVGARLTGRLAIATSHADRRIMDLPLPPVGKVTHLGIDDFALRRGRTYGTVLVDLKRHKVLDLLPDRKAETAQAWIETHPEIELISRDRGGDYAAAARKGAPQAIQTADRFHLVKNLAEDVKEALAHCGTQIRKDRKAMEAAIATEPVEPLPLPVTSNGQPYSAHQTERYERYQQVVALRDQGVKLKEIATRVGLGIRTVQRWVSQNGYVETNYQSLGTTVVTKHTRLTSRSDGRKDVITSNSSGVKSKLRDIPIQIVHCEGNSGHDREKRKGVSYLLRHWTTLRPRQQSGSLSVHSTILMPRSERNSKPFVRPVKQSRSFTNWFKSFCRWFANETASNLRTG